MIPNFPHSSTPIQTPGYPVSSSCRHLRSPGLARRGGLSGVQFLCADREALPCLVPAAQARCFHAMGRLRRTRVCGVPAVSRHGFPARPSVLRPAFLSLRSPALHPEKKSLTMRAGPDFHSYAISSSFAKHDTIKEIKPLLSTRSLRPRTQVACQASFASFSFPELESKPKWWWRTLACVPYLLPLHNMWLQADAIYHLHPYLPRFNLLYAFIDTMALLPGWLFLVIFMTIYFFVVRQKWSPHFLRFHIILAILLDTGSQALATACNWNPSIIFQGKPMAYFWMTMAFIQIFTVLECMRFVLSGVYANIPFISHAAFIHSDLNLFR